MERFRGADRRRHAGLSCDIKFVSVPQGPNELLKDKTVKENLPEMFSEFWFLVRVLWLCPAPFPSSDIALP
eukprot:12156028-Karenia_brevis.AAC.1